MLRSDTLQVIAGHFGPWSRTGSQELKFINDLVYAVLAPLDKLRRELIDMNVVRSVIGQALRFLWCTSVQIDDVKCDAWSKLRQHVESRVVTAHLDHIMQARFPDAKLDEKSPQQVAAKVGAAGSSLVSRDGEGAGVEEAPVTDQVELLFSALNQDQGWVDDLYKRIVEMRKMGMNHKDYIEYGTIPSPVLRPST